MDCLCRGRCALERRDFFVSAPAYAAVKIGTGKKRALLGHVEHLQAAALHVCRQAHLPFQGMAQRQVFTAELCLRGDGRDPGCTPRRPRKIYALDPKAARWQVGITEKEIKFALWYDYNNKGQRAAGSPPPVRTMWLDGARIKGQIWLVPSVHRLLSPR